MLRAYFVPKHLVQILDSQRPLRRNGVERSLYSRAVGYSFNSEKIFCNKDGEVTRVPIVEHVPPDVTAQIFWLKNRKPTSGATSSRWSTCSGSTSSPTSR